MAVKLAVACFLVLFRLMSLYHDAGSLQLMPAFAVVIIAGSLGYFVVMVSEFISKSIAWRFVSGTIAVLVVTLVPLASHYEGKLLVAAVDALLWASQFCVAFWLAHFLTNEKSQAGRVRVDSQLSGHTVPIASQEFQNVLRPRNDQR